MRELGKQQIEDIALGATVLGTGGGGDPYLGKLMALNAMAEYGNVKMITHEEVPDDALVVPIAFMGAPVILIEKLANGNEAKDALKMLEEKLGKKAFALMPIEAGGMNSMAPLALAAELGLPIVDSDAMGTAYPQLQMVTFTLHDIPSTPLAQADEKGNRVLYETISNLWSEILAGNAIIPMGGACVIACYPVLGKQLKKAGIHDIVTYSEEIGSAIREAKNNSLNPVKTLIEKANGHLLFEGKITDVVRNTEGRFLKGLIKVEGLNDFSDSKMDIDFQNEFLMAKVNGKTVAMVPDLITIVDTETAKPITTETIKYGFRISVIGMPGNEQWRTEKGLEIVGPNAFGYSEEYQPVEKLNQ